MTVVYYTTNRFPDGGMATGNRIAQLARALVDNGCKVIVCSPYSDSGKRETLVRDGVEYRSFCEARSYLAKRLSMYIMYPLRVMAMMRKDHDAQQCIYTYTPGLWQMICAYLVSRIAGCPVCREGCEYPYSVIGQSSRWKRFVEVRIVLKFYHGIVAITENLKKYYSGHSRQGCKVIRIPMTVDCDRFDNERRPSPFDFEYIAYTGSMRRNGGGVDVIVKAFALLSKDFPEMHLVLIGNGSEDTKRALVKLVPDELVSKMHFLFGGNIPANDMPMYVKNARMLAMLPLPTKQQEGCFPTKLGEYLASGVPAIVSKVGVPVQYLTDGKNVRFAPPGDVDATAAVMKDVLANYSKAREIAESGRRFARENFHYAKFGSQLIEFYKKVFADFP